MLEPGSLLVHSELIAIVSANIFDSHSVLGEFQVTLPLGSVADKEYSVVVDGRWGVGRDEVLGGLGEYLGEGLGHWGED